MSPEMPIRVVFFGTASFAVPILEALALNPAAFAVVAVVTQPDKPAGRKGEIRSSPVADAASKLGIPRLQPAKLRDEETLRTIATLTPDLFVVAAYGKIIPKNMLAVPRIAALNLHGSLLPKYRGASPIQAAIAAGELETGVSLMIMDEEVDHGPVLANAVIPITDEDTYETLEKRLADLAAKLLLEHVEEFVAGRLKPMHQVHDLATFTRILTREDGVISWKDQTATEIERKTRAYRLWPGCSTVWKRRGENLTLKIIRAKTTTKAGEANALPGTVALVEGKVIVKAKEGWLEMVEVQPEGKRAMSADIFLNGYRDIVGAVLESSPSSKAPEAP